jgi:hypothetical protein
MRTATRMPEASVTTLPPTDQQVGNRDGVG